VGLGGFVRDGMGDLAGEPVRGGLHGADGLSLAHSGENAYPLAIREFCQ
jgi:hypothetical protein